MFGLGMTEIMVLLILGVLLFGKNLPEVGKSIGKMIADFKRSMSGMEDSLTGGNYDRQPPAPPPTPMRPPQRIAPVGQKFEDAPPPEQTI
jgi:sec-independent protein translocase protein TatA